jgi:hypothetical protein
MTNEPDPLFYEGKTIQGPDAEIEQFVRRVLDHNHNNLMEADADCWECRIRSLIFNTVRSQLFKATRRPDSPHTGPRSNRAGRAR